MQIDRLSRRWALYAAVNFGITMAFQEEWSRLNVWIRVPMSATAKIPIEEACITMAAQGQELPGSRQPQLIVMRGVLPLSLAWWHFHRCGEAPLSHRLCDDRRVASHRAILPPLRWCDADAANLYGWRAFPHSPRSTFHPGWPQLNHGTENVEFAAGDAAAVAAAPGLPPL